MQISIGLTFPGTLKDESVICYLCKKYDIEIIIIEASFSMSSGWAILKVIGEEKEIQRAFEYLASKNIVVRRIETKQQA